MERLTKRKYGGVVSRKQEETGVYCSVFCNECADGAGNCSYVKEMIEKLVAYEDTGFTLEQVVEMAKELAELKKQLPPCKVGNTVHWVNNHYRTYGDYKIDEEKVERLIFDGEDWGADMGGPKDGVFGETVFLTKEEAEAKLKEMEGK